MANVEDGRFWDPFLSIAANLEQWERALVSVFLMDSPAVIGILLFWLLLSVRER